MALSISIATCTLSIPPRTRVPAEATTTRATSSGVVTLSKTPGSRTWAASARRPRPVRPSACRARRTLDGHPRGVVDPLGLPRAVVGDDQQRLPSGTPQTGVGLGLPSLVNVVSSRYFAWSTSLNVGATLRPPRQFQADGALGAAAQLGEDVEDLADDAVALADRVGRRPRCATSSSTVAIASTASPLTLPLHVADGEGDPRGVADALDLPRVLLGDHQRAVAVAGDPDRRSAWAGRPW